MIFLRYGSCNYIHTSSYGGCPYGGDAVFYIVGRPLRQRAAQVCVSGMFVGHFGAIVLSIIGSEFSVKIFEEAIYSAGYDAATISGCARGGGIHERPHRVLPAPLQGFLIT